ncbi:MAG: tRNA (adenosine(37)-N6)-threonylcarbamoyltransferase complex dimerization subunit type 1 TsaB [Alphaproteobacteria bacterium]
MKILAADTALGACSVAVLDGGKIRARAFELMARGHAEALAPMVERVMRDAALDFRMLDRLGVTTGPGTFTGQRVGIAFMRGLALTLKRPLAGVTTLDVMAEEALERTGAIFAVSCADARRGEIYFSLRGRAGLRGEPMLLAIGEAAMRVASQIPQTAEVALAGTASQIFAPLLAARGLKTRDSMVRQPDAVFVAELAEREPEPRHAPAPLYLRPPDAKPSVAP